MSYRWAFLLLAGVFVLHFSRILFQGEVIFPHDNGLEVGLSEKPSSTRIFNRRFSDESRMFIPELANNLDSKRKSWLATWNPHVQLGRASYQVSGLSRAYLLTNALSCLTSNPFKLYTALALVTVGLTGCFLLLLLRSLGLHPTSAVVAAIGLAFGTFSSYWLTFVLFLSAFCWLTCLLWLVTEFTQRPSWLLALGLAFAAYSLLMTAYQQIAILCFYIVGAYSLIRVAQMSADLRIKLQTTVALIGCIAAGALASLPVYLDLLSLAKHSARLKDVSDSFFVGVLPKLHDLREWGSFFVTIFDWSWLGNVIEPNYPLSFAGLSFTPVYGSLIWLSLFVKPRRSVLFWQLLLIICLVATIFPAVYLFAVHHLGFGLSRIQLLAGAIVPGFVLSAFTVDAVLRGELRLTVRSAVWLLVPLIAESVMAFLIWRRFPIDARAVVATFLLVAALLGSIYWRSNAAFIGVAVLSAFLYGRALILSRPPETIHTSSKLVDAVKTSTPDGSRFAIDDGPMFELPSNEEALLGLNSVNSCDPLSSRQYQELMSKWGASRNNRYGAYFRSVDARAALPDHAFRLANVAVILSRRALPAERAVLIDEVGGIKLYRPVTIPFELRQTSRFRLFDAGHALMDVLPEVPKLDTRRVRTLSDFQKIQVTTSAQETLLFLSQQYHRAWHASSRQQSLRTVTVNGFYQGILLPPFTKEVELSFRPLALWSWVPQLLFVIAGVWLLLRAFWRIRRDEVCVVR